MFIDFPPFLLLAFFVLEIFDSFLLVKTKKKTKQSNQRSDGDVDHSGHSRTFHWILLQTTARFSSSTLSGMLTILIYLSFSSYLVIHFTVDGLPALELTHTIFKLFVLWNDSNSLSLMINELISFAGEAWTCPDCCRYLCVCVCVCQSPVCEPSQLIRYRPTDDCNFIDDIFQDLYFLWFIIIIIIIILIITKPLYPPGLLLFKK